MVVDAVCPSEVLLEASCWLNSIDSDRLTSDDGLLNDVFWHFMVQFIDCEQRPVAEPVHSTGQLKKLGYMFRLGYELSSDHSTLTF